MLIFLGIIVIESMLVAGQQLNSDNEYDTTSSVNANEGVIAAYRRPTVSANGGNYKRVLKVRKDTNQQPVPVVGRRVNRPSNSEDSVPASSNKNSFTVNNYDDNDDYFSRRRARFLFRQRVGK